MNTFKVLIKILLIAALAYLLQNLFAWWVIVIASLLINFIIYSKGASSIVSGFLGIGLLWLFTALIVDVRTDSILTHRVALIFSLPSTGLLILATAIVGGLAGGFGGLTGSYLRILLMPPRWE